MGKKFRVRVWMKRAMRMMHRFYGTFRQTWRRLLSSLSVPCA